jgi:hypothetical protein
MEPKIVDVEIDADGERLERLSLTGLGGGEPRSGDISGVRALMLAVLEDAVRCYLESDREVADEAELWTRSRLRSWPFAFDVVCEALSLDADAVRAALRRMKEASGSRPPIARRLRRNGRTAGKMVLRERKRRSRMDMHGPSAVARLAVSPAA